MDQAGLSSAPKIPCGFRSGRWTETKRLGELAEKIHVCFYAAPFGVIPMELDEVYPLSQHEIAMPLDQETVDYVANQTAEYIKQQHYTTVVLLHDPEQWGKTVKTQCSIACQKKA